MSSAQHNGVPICDQGLWALPQYTQFRYSGVQEQPPWAAALRWDLSQCDHVTVSCGTYCSANIYKLDNQKLDPCPGGQEHTETSTACTHARTHTHTWSRQCRLLVVSKCAGCFCFGSQPSPECGDIEGSSSEEDEDSDDESEDEDDEDENDEPLSLKWPETRRKQAIYLFLLPVVFPLWLTVPDVRNPVRFYFLYAQQSPRSLFSP